MIFNYKSLNDNTYKDQYSLPGINTILKRIGGAKIFSKFDLKSGFHQVAMDEESIPWTAFLVPGGLYEWLVMPFGLKNAPANEKDHAKHLEIMLKICEDNGLVLSPTKMNIAVSTVDFLGAVIEEGIIKLLPHIIKKIVNFIEEELKTKKRLRMYKRNEEKTTTTLYSIEEVLQSPNAFQKNMKTTCEEVMKISNHFLESSQKLSSHMKNQEHYTNDTSSRPTKPQSEWINLMHGDQSLKTLNFQQQKKEDVRIQNKEARRILIELVALAQRLGRNNINHPEDDAIKDDDKYRYTRKGFLEDDESSDDSILIVDPGWDDYCLQELKLNPLVPLCPEARRARM
ncbi:Orf y [Tanacetum coccineum]